jgi:hypothetical protein
MDVLAVKSLEFSPEHFRGLVFQAHSATSLLGSVDVRPHDERESPESLMVGIRTHD